MYYKSDQAKIWYLEEEPFVLTFPSKKMLKDLQQFFMVYKSKDDVLVKTLAYGMYLTKTKTGFLVQAEQRDFPVKTRVKTVPKWEEKTFCEIICHTGGDLEILTTHQLSNEYFWRPVLVPLSKDHLIQPLDTKQNPNGEILCTGTFCIGDRFIDPRDAPWYCMDERPLQFMDLPPDQPSDYKIPWIYWNGVLVCATCPMLMPPRKLFLQGCLAVPERGLERLLFDSEN